MLAFVDCRRPLTPLLGNHRNVTPASRVAQRDRLVQEQMLLLRCGAELLRHIAGTAVLSRSSQQFNCFLIFNPLRDPSAQLLFSTETATATGVASVRQCHRTIDY